MYYDTSTLLNPFFTRALTLDWYEEVEGSYMGIQAPAIYKKKNKYKGFVAVTLRCDIESYHKCILRLDKERADCIVSGREHFFPSLKLNNLLNNLVYCERMMWAFRYNSYNDKFTQLEYKGKCNTFDGYYGHLATLMNHMTPFRDWIFCSETHKKAFLTTKFREAIMERFIMESLMEF